MPVFLSSKAGDSDGFRRPAWLPLHRGSAALIIGAEFAVDGWWTSWTSLSDASQLKALKIPANKEDCQRRSPFTTHESAQWLPEVASKQDF